MLLVRAEHFYKVGLLFFVTQIFGIHVATSLATREAFLRPASLTNFSVVNVAIIVASLMVFLVIAVRLHKIGQIFYKLVLTFLILTGMQAALSIVLEPMSALIFSVAFVIVFWYANTVLTHNLIMIVTLSGIGALFGFSFTPLVAVFLLVALSFYDIVAVYKTKHMAKVAEGMIQSHTIFGFVIPERVEDFVEKIINVKEGERFMILGSGDIVLPLLLAASIAIADPYAAILVAIFATFGLFGMYILFLNQKIRKPIAALPPIAAAAIIGYLLTML